MAAVARTSKSGRGTWTDPLTALYAWEGRPEPKSPFLALRQAAIYLQHPSSGSEKTQTPIFPRLSFSLDAARDTHERWVVISSGGSPLVRTKFLHTLQGKYTCVPPTARVWPYLASDEVKARNSGVAREPSRAIQYVGFSNQSAGSGGTGTQGAYLGARYESRRETTDWSVQDYLRGSTSLNLSAEQLNQIQAIEKDPAFEKVIREFKLDNFLSLPVSNLSNGQTRRARIAKAILQKPELLLLDEPFAGLDPVNSRVLSELLCSLAERSEPRILLALPPTEVPHWITHAIHLNSDGFVWSVGEKAKVYKNHRDLAFVKAGFGKPKNPIYTFADPEKERKKRELREKTAGLVTRHANEAIHKSKDEEDNHRLISKNDPDFVFWNTPDALSPDSGSAQPVVEMNGVKVAYGDRCVLGNWTQEVNGEQQDGLHWKVNQGDRWAIFGPNGSGKTTIISLLTSDHPQAYKLPLKVFGRHRLPTAGQPGISVFDLQSRIGHSSPEIHTYFPKHFSIRRTIESAFADSFHGKPTLGYEDDQSIDSGLRWFQKELDPALTPERDPLDKFWGRRRDYNRLILRHGRPWGGSNETIIRERSNQPPSWADDVRFSELSLQAQRVALFLRAVIAKPDMIVLDEAFSGMDEVTRKKCMMFLAHGEEKVLIQPTRKSAIIQPKVLSPLKMFGVSKISGLEPRQALICISHRKEEIPFVVDKWMRLPEPNEGKPAVFGQIDHEKDWWADVWDS